MKAGNAQTFRCYNLREGRSKERRRWSKLLHLDQSLSQTWRFALFSSNVRRDKQRARRVEIPLARFFSIDLCKIFRTDELLVSSLTYAAQNIQNK